MVRVRSYGPSASGTTHAFTIIPPSEEASNQRLELDFSGSPGSVVWYAGRGESSGLPEQRQVSGSITASQVPGGAWGGTISLGDAPLAVPSYFLIVTGSAVTVTVRLVSR